MKQDELFLKLAESIETAKSAINASERWMEKLGESVGVKTDKIESLVQEISTSPLTGGEDEKVVEGVFDGQNMQDTEGNKYPVPANYASKSKLIEGDRLKLTIAENGAFIFKQIELIPRKLIVGHLVLDGSQYQVLAEGKTYNVLYASVTFFRAKVGDEVTIIVPEVGTSKWSAIENIIPQKDLEE